VSADRTTHLHTKKNGAKISVSVVSASFPLDDISSAVRVERACPYRFAAVSDTVASRRRFEPEPFLDEKLRFRARSSPLIA
jgi:hypothetical protein